MQNMPITTANTQPATQAQTANPADGTQVAEPFGNILARQRANTDEPKHNAGIRDKSQHKSYLPGSSPTDIASAVTGKKLETPATDVASLLPGDMPAALPPATASRVAAKEKPASQAPTPDGVSTLPSDMLAALLSAPATIQTSAVTQQPIADGARGDTRQLSIAVGAEGDARQQLVAGGAMLQLAASGARHQPIAVGAQVGAQQFTNTAQPIGEQTTTPLLRAPGNTAPTVAATDQGKTFSSVLETLGKDAISTTLSAGATQASIQAALPDANTLASLNQSAVPPLAASQNDPVQATVNTPVTHDAWGDEFNQKVTWLATQQEQTAELHLNPPHLGPLDIKLNISGDQATALFTSPHAAVREAVEQALPKLREMLADNGIMLGNATVNDQSPREQQAGQPDKQRGGSLFGKISDAVPASSTVLPARRHHGMVDTFV